MYGKKNFLRVKKLVKKLFRAVPYTLRQHWFLHLNTGNTFLYLHNMYAKFDKLQIK
jgi:hypothetical protein